MAGFGFQFAKNSSPTVCWYTGPAPGEPVLGILGLSLKCVNFGNAASVKPASIDSGPKQMYILKMASEINDALSVDLKVYF